MKCHFMRVVIVLGILASSLSAHAQQQATPTPTPPPSLDILFEGPWVFHEDDNFSNGAAPAHVVIAMAPQNAHHSGPILTAGDPLQIPSPGVYCVAVGICAPPNTTTLSSGSYPAPALVPVRTKPGWKWWSDAFNTNAVYLILPIPDSFSADGTEPMEFSSTFGMNFGLPEDHAIGTVFHYTKGADKLTIWACNRPGKELNATDCSNTPNGSITNTGTYRIAMKHKEDPTDQCSVHLRAAWPAMLYLLDDTELNSTLNPNSTNVNQDKAFIDLRDAKNDFGMCFASDPQNCGHVHCPDPMKAKAITCEKESKHGPVRLSDQLDEIVNLLKSDPLKNYALNLEELEPQANALHGHFPLLSQLIPIDEALDKSLQGIYALFRKSNQLKLHPAKGKSTTPIPVEPLQRVQCAEKVLKNDIVQLKLAISGKDCRSAELLTGP
jgi:hypothetical protein